MLDSTTPPVLFFHAHTMNAFNLPPYALLAAKLRERIEAKALPPGAWLDTEVALAEENGLSRMTARRAVQALVDEGLVERRAGRGVFVRGAEAPRRAIRFVAGNLIWTPAVRVAHAVQEGAESTGFTVTVFDGRGDMAAVLSEIRALPRSGAAGAILMSQHDSAFNRELAALVAAGFPFVVVDQELSELPGDSVSSDNRAGGRLAVEELFAAGHRRLAFLGDLSADTTAARAQGVSEACASALVPPPLRLDIPGQRFDDWEPEIHKRIVELLRTRPRPTGLACSCDAVARHAMRVLADAGMSVPRDIAVTGFDDDPIAEWTSPALTTIRQDFPEMGRRALALLARRIADPSIPPCHENVPVTLVRRASVAPSPCPVAARRPRAKRPLPSLLTR